jgi:lysozyme
MVMPLARKMARTVGKISLLATALTWLAPSPALAQSASDRPWLMPNPVLVIDPFEDNAINWDQLVADGAVKAIIHRAFHGKRADTKFEARVAEAKRRGLSAGIYLLGKPGDPIAQADLLIAAGKRVGVTLLALDIENMDPADSMSLANAQKFINRVKEKTGRFPLFYTNFSTYQHISRHFGADSAFAKTPLWVARFRSSHGLNSTNVWRDYAFWQFQSEINCKPGQTCSRRVPGTSSDMDVNIFRGTEAELRVLFGE